MGGMMGSMKKAGSWRPWGGASDGASAPLAEPAAFAPHPRSPHPSVGHLVDVWHWLHDANAPDDGRLERGLAAALARKGVELTDRATGAGVADEAALAHSCRRWARACAAVAKSGDGAALAHLRGRPVNVRRSYADAIDDEIDLLAADVARLQAAAKNPAKPPPRPAAAAADGDGAPAAPTAHGIADAEWAEYALGLALHAGAPPGDRAKLGESGGLLARCRDAKLGGRDATVAALAATAHTEAALVGRADGSASADPVYLGWVKAGRPAAVADARALVAAPLDEADRRPALVAAALAEQRAPRGAVEAVPAWKATAARHAETLLEACALAFDALLDEEDAGGKATPEADRLAAVALAAANAVVCENLAADAKAAKAVPGRTLPGAGGPLEAWAEVVVVRGAGAPYWATLGDQAHLSAGGADEANDDVPVVDADGAEHLVPRHALRSCRGLVDPEVRVVLAALAMRAGNVDAAARHYRRFDRDLEPEALPPPELYFVASAGWCPPGER